MPSDAGTIGMGVLGGAGKGAAIGSIFGPAGTAVGAGIGAVVGGIGAGNKVGARNDALDRVENIPMFDPMQLNFLDTLNREKRAVESGFTTDFQVAKDLNQKSLAGGLSVAESVAATNPALALSMIDTSSKNYSTGVNQALGTISTRSQGYTSSIGQLINMIAQRKLDVETYKTSQQLGLATDDLQTSNVNNAQFAGRLPQYMDAIGELPMLLDGLGAAASGEIPNVDIASMGAGAGRATPSFVPLPSIPN